MAEQSYTHKETHTHICTQKQTIFRISCACTPGITKDQELEVRLCLEPGYMTLQAYNIITNGDQTNATPLMNVGFKALSKMTTVQNPVIYIKSLSRLISFLNLHYNKQQFHDQFQF